MYYNVMRQTLFQSRQFMKSEIAGESLLKRQGGIQLWRGLGIIKQTSQTTTGLCWSQFLPIKKDVGIPV
jgi:hypothetical protein